MFFIWGIINLKFIFRPSEDILGNLVQTGTMDELQKDIIKQGLHRMYNLCENKVLMLNLGKLICTSDLDQEFDKISDGCIKMLAVILNCMKATLEKLHSGRDVEIQTIQE